MIAEDRAIFVSRAVLRLSSIEFWERYSYYTTFALLALFAAAPVASGGMGWENAQSLRFFGTYLFTVQVTPIVGGWLADRHVGKRLALRLGAGSLACGHALIAGAAAVPWLSAGGTTLAAAASAHGVALGGLYAPAVLGSTQRLYLLASTAFYGGVAMIAVGNGLFKPILTVVVGRLPHRDEQARTRAFTTFFLYINIGGLLSVLLGGFIAERYGWSWAFVGSALGMLVAIATTFAVDRRYLRPFLDDRRSPGGDAPEPAGSSGGFKAIGLLLLLLILCSAFSFQSYGFISLFTAQLVRRDIAGFVVPPTWFTALNPITIMVMTPILLRVWRRGGLGSDWTTVQHMAAALACMALGFAPLIGALFEAQRSGLASPLWVAAAVMLIAVSELLYSPAGMAASTRLAPPRMQTLAIGAQGAAIGVGAWCSGQIGALAFSAGKIPVMTAVAATAVVASVVLWSVRTRAARVGL